MNKKQKWFWVALVAVFLAAPNAMSMKVAVNGLDPFLVNVARFILVAFACTPFLVKAFPRLKGAALQAVLAASAAMTVAAFAFIFALKYSTASYVSVLLLLQPIMLVWYSVRLNKERVSRRALAGITLAAAGATLIVLLPLALMQNEQFVFYPVATILCLLNCLLQPLAVIKIKQANEKGGVPLLAITAVMSYIITAANAVFWLAKGAPIPAHVDGVVVGAIVYWAIINTLIARTLLVKGFEVIGSASISALTYFEMLLSVLFPVAFLHEKISLPMALGGVLILLGVYVVQHHKSDHHKHHHLYRLG